MNGPQNTHERRRPQRQGSMATGPATSKGPGYGVLAQPRGLSDSRKTGAIGIAAPPAGTARAAHSSVPGVNLPSYGSPAELQGRAMPRTLTARVPQERPTHTPTARQRALVGRGVVQGTQQSGTPAGPITVPTLEERQDRAQQVAERRRNASAGIRQTGRSLAGGAGSPMDTRYMPAQARATVEQWQQNPPQPAFAPSAQQRQLVSQGIDQAIPAAAAVPPTDGGEGHGPTDQLPNAPEPTGAPPQRLPAFNDGAGATYTTGTGRTGNLPAGVAVDYREDGTPVFTSSPGAAAAIAQQQPTQQPMAALARMLSNTPTMQQGAQQQTPQRTAPRRLTSRPTETNAGEASRMASMRRNDMAWDMRRMGRGSPSTRRALMDAYMQEQRLGADAVQGQANRDNQVDIAAMGHQAQAAEGAANRQLTASGQMLTAAQQAEQARQFNMGSRTLTGADGTVSLLRNDGTVAPLQGADGEPFRPAPTSVGGQVTPAIQYQALSQQLRSMQETAAMNPNSGLDQQIQEIQAQMNALAGGGQAVPAQHIQMLREDPSIADEFDEQYGPGASRFVLREAASGS